MNIVLCSVRDNQIDDLAYALNSLSGIRPSFLALPLDGDDMISVSASEVVINDMVVTADDIVFVHGFSYVDPIIPRDFQGKDWSVWDVDYVLDQQRFSATYSLLTELFRRGITVINSPNIHTSPFLKWHMFERLRESGWLVPDIVCTNDSAEAQRFIDTHQRAVWRPVTGPAPWQFFAVKQLNALVSEQKPPVVVASIAEGPLLRAYMYSGECLLMLESGAPAPGPPEDLEVVWQVEVAQELLDRLRTILDRIGVNWAQVLFVPVEGVPCVYDIEPDPVYTWLPRAYYDYLTQALAKRLLTCGNTEPAPNLGLRSRSSLITRRMLRIIFEIENSKFH